MNERELKAWAAGFIDGEGSVVISRRLSNGGPLYTYELRLTVGQRGTVPLERLLALFGGTIGKPLPSGVSMWRVTGITAGLVLGELAPMMLVKHKQALVAAEFQTLLRPRGSRGRQPLTAEDLAARERLMLQMRAANREHMANDHWRHRRS